LTATDQRAWNDGAQPDSYSQDVLADTQLTRVVAYIRYHLAEPDLTRAVIGGAHSVSIRHLYKLCVQADISLEQWIITQCLERAR
jgi:hypothetical protein